MVCCYFCWGVFLVLSSSFFMIYMFFCLFFVLFFVFVCVFFVLFGGFLGGGFIVVLVGWG